MSWLRRSWTVAVLLCLALMTLAPRAVAQGEDGPDTDDQIGTSRGARGRNGPERGPLQRRCRNRRDGRRVARRVQRPDRDHRNGRDVVVFAGDIVLPRAPGWEGTSSAWRSSSRS
jgi:hypothetical protein